MINKYNNVINTLFKNVNWIPKLIQQNGTHNFRSVVKRIKEFHLYFVISFT